MTSGISAPDIIRSTMVNFKYHSKRMVPSIEFASGTKQWHFDGVLHRDNHPAVRHPDGGSEYWFHGHKHNTNGPAIFRADGLQEWWDMGKRHRTDGPAFISPGGHKEWWYKGEKREPFSIVYTIDCCKWLDQKEQLHRADGPAVTYLNGKKEWWLDGFQYTENQYNEKMGISPIVDFNKDLVVYATKDSRGGWTKSVHHHHAWHYCDDDGQLHNTDGPALEYTVGDNDMRHGRKEWFVHGIRHRVDGPAVEDNQYSMWYVDGKLHRLDGPAKDYKDGFKAWYVDSKLHRLDGPAVIDPHGEVFGCAYWLNGTWRPDMHITFPLKKFFGKLFA